jgi:hypothetical protein
MYLFTTGYKGNNVPNLYTRLLCYCERPPRSVILVLSPLLPNALIMAVIIISPESHLILKAHSHRRRAGKLP